MKNLITLLCLSVLWACNAPDASKEAEHADHNASADSALVEQHVKLKNDTLQHIFDNYIELKNALVKSDAVASAEHAKKLELSLAKFPGCETTSVMAKNMADSKDLKDQRKLFTALSTDLIALYKSVDLGANSTIYVQHCPMANKGDGGDWLAKEKQIRNPYYGDEMLECGNVVEEIKSK